MAIIMIIDMIIIGYISFNLVKGIFGDGPLGRILAVLSFIIGAIIYGNLVAWTDSNIESMVIGTLIILGPIGLALLSLLLAYAFDGEKHND